jgi:hypothetical protein
MTSQFFMDHGVGENHQFGFHSFSEAPTKSG